MNKDTIIAELSFTGLVNSPFHICSSNCNLYFLKNDIALNSWIDKRRSPFYRRYMNELYKITNIDSNYRYAIVSRLLSLTDTFWLKLNSNEKWSSYSLFRNSFSKVLSDISFGLDKFRGRVYESPSPELSLDGMSMKCWKRFNNQIYLLKSGGGLAELEFSQAYSEFLASQIAEFLNIDSFIRYDIVSIKGIIASRCKLFTSENIGFISFCDLFPDSGDIETDLGYLKSQRDIRLYKQMMILDSLIYNFDRHNENYGFLFDTNTLNIICLAPIFDNDRSLFSANGVLNKSNNELLELMKMYTPRTYSTFTGQAVYCMTDEMYNRLEYFYNNFHFINHDKFPMNSDRMIILEKLVRFSALNILRSC